MICGVLLVATDCPSGPHEILRGGDLGILVPVGDSGALAQAIDEALDGKCPPTDAQSWQPYTPDAVVHEYLQLLLDEEGQR